MDQARINKILTLSFLLFSALVFWVMGVLLDTASGSFATVARLKAMPMVQHGIPLICAAAVFVWLQMSKKTRELGDEVITEVSKVVWPTQKDVKGMTVAVSIMLIISGIVLAGFDLAAGKTLRMILGM